MDLSFFLEPVNVMMFAIIIFIGVFMAWFRDMPAENPVKKRLSPKVEGKELEERFGL